MKAPKIYSIYDRPEHKGEFNKEPTMTQQSFKDECDINNILAQFMSTGIIDSIGPGAFADVSTLGDYRSALDVLAQAQEAFDQLPSHIRKEFDNDPANYLDFVHDENNHEKGVKLGIFNPKKDKEIRVPDTPSTVST